MWAKLGTLNWTPYYLNLTRTLGIDDKKVIVAKTKNGERKIKARAIWYDEMKAKIVKEK